MKLRALLIGINAYPTRPLEQCVSDMKKMSKYLTGIKDQFDDISIKPLKDEEATRSRILAEIKDHLGQAGDEDVALFYYSGHGAQEECPGLFADVHDGLLECLVCYDPNDVMDSTQLLASKEIRYALSQLPNNPHLVTIIDSCHSGDIVRAYHAEDPKGKRQIKRIAGSYPARPYEAFLFGADASVVTEVGDKKTVFIPAKNHIHIAACLSTESSWEDSGGGVFTRYLIELLKATGGNISYLDITRWAKISMHEVTKEKQTPTISTIGEGKWSAADSWLNLNRKGLAIPEGKIINTVSDGWVFNRGALLGIQPGLEVIIKTGKDTEERVTVDKVELEQSTLDMPMTLVNKLEKLKQPFFIARTELSTLGELKISIESIDHEPKVEEMVNQLLTGNKQVKIVDTVASDFQITIFNGFVYFTLPEHDFQPLAKQIELKDEAVMKNELKRQLDYFIKWHHFYALDNPGKDYEQSPIRIEVERGKDKWVDITNGVLTMEPDPHKVKNGMQFQTAKVRINNTSEETVYVGVLTLNSDLSITSKPLQGNTIALVPKQSETVLLYKDEPNPVVRAFFDTYKQVYNWKEEWFYYKFIYSNYEDFTTSLSGPDFRQPALEPPLIKTKPTKSKARMARGEDGGEPEPEIKRWGTCLTRVELPNLQLNKIVGNLEELWAEYESSEELAPFIKELYFDEVFDGTAYKLVLKQNKDETSLQASRASSNWLIKMMNKLYKSSRIRRFKRQRKKGGPIVVAEGDSWFLFPKPGVRDTLDYIMDEYVLLGLAEAGDEIVDYIKNPELLTSIIKENPDFVLISGGGNDILGEQVQDLLLSGVLNGASAADYLKEEVFLQKLEQLRKGYVSFFEKIHALKPDAKIFIHGYDYIRSAPDDKTIKNGWANRYMIKAGIEVPAHRELIIRHLVDKFNDMLKGFADKYDYVTYVNHRGTVQLTEWMDEIHPNNNGYKKVADNFLKAMKAV